MGLRKKIDVLLKKQGVTYSELFKQIKLLVNAPKKVKPVKAEQPVLLAVKLIGTPEKIDGVEVAKFKGLTDQGVEFVISALERFKADANEFVAQVAAAQNGTQCDWAAGQMRRVLEGLKAQLPTTPAKDDTQNG